MSSLIANGCDLLALVALVGALVQSGWLFPPEPAAVSGAAADALARRGDHFVTIALAWLTLTTLAALVARSLDLSGAAISALGPVLPPVLRQTYFGHVWLLRIAVVLLLWFVWVVARGRASRRVAVVLLAGTLLEAWGWCVNAHPGDHGGFTPDVWVAMAHILAAGLWGGTVLAVAIVALPARRLVAALDTAHVLRFVRRLSSVSALGLALVVASGIYNTWVQFGAWSDFWTTTFGRVLAIKLAFVALLALIGAGNRFWRVPRVLRACGADRSGTGVAADRSVRGAALDGLLYAVGWEAVVLVAVLIAVSVLVATMPPVMPGMIHGAVTT